MRETQFCGHEFFIFRSNFSTSRNKKKLQQNVEDQGYDLIIY